MQRKFNFGKSKSTNTSKFVIYTDGACEPNPGLGGWSFIVYCREEAGLKETSNQFGGMRHTTNNIMEMTGVLNAIFHAKSRFLPVSEVVIKTDSMYVVNGCNSWRHGWKRRGWKRGPNKELANAELWMAIDAALESYPCAIEWVKGHAGEVGNERADKLAEAGRQSVLKAA